MKLLGFILLLSGWGIVVAAFHLLQGRSLTAFTIAGLAVEVLGLVLVGKGHLPTNERPR